MFKQRVRLVIFTPMDHAQLDTITDVKALRRIVREKLDAIAIQQKIIADRDATLASRERTIVYKDAKIEVLTMEIARLRRVQFAARSEKMDPEQRSLFDEAIAADIAAVESELEALKTATVDTPAAKAPRSIPKRRPLPPELERVEVRHEPESCTCGQCGIPMVKIGEHVSGPLLRILRTRHWHIHVRQNSTASRWNSSCVATCIRNTRVGPARRWSPSRFNLRSSSAASPRRVCWHKC